MVKDQERREGLIRMTNVSVQGVVSGGHLKGRNIETVKERRMRFMRQNRQVEIQ